MTARDGQRAQELLRSWAEGPIPPDDPTAADLRRRRVVAATALTIARAAGARAKRERLLRLGTVFASAAALLAVAGIGWRIRSRLHRAPDETASIAQAQLLAGSIHRSHGSLPLPAVAPDGRVALGAGDEVTTEANGRGEIVLSDGVAVTLESRTRFRLPDAPAQANEQVGLDAGAVFVRVPPLPPGHTFAIRTPDTIVTVHGTAFAVEVMPGAHGLLAPSATHVRVSSGVVSVATGGHEVFLTAGMEWFSPTMDTAPAPHAAAVEPSRDAPLVATPAALPAAGPARVVPPRRGHTQARPTARDESVSSSTLGEENHLLASAIAASNGGDYEGAVGTLDDLLRRFPTSPVAPEAHVQRFRALERSGDAAAAAREARTYLALYPEGSAREEAKRLAVQP